MSLSNRSNRRVGSAVAHVASLCCISLIIKGLHLIGSDHLHSKQLAIPLMPSLVHMSDLMRIGEAAGRSLFPCLPQVDANASVWLRSPLGPCPYICARIRVSPATCPSTPFSIPPVTPCRRRRHFSPQTRVNRFVFLNLPILSLGNHLGVTVSPQFPLPAGYVTLPVDSRSPPLGLMLPHSGKQGTSLYLLSQCIPNRCLPISRGEAHRR
jgi:hypothetical protein